MALIYSAMATCVKLPTYYICIVRINLQIHIFLPGMNSIYVYVGSETLEDLIPISFAVSQTHLAQLFINLWSTSFWVIIAAYMYYKDIFISV